MKKLLLLAAALLATSSAFADWYIVGSDVNGAEWNNGAADAKFSATSTSGVFEWEGKTLGNKFKITDGTWGALDMGKKDGNLTLGTPYTYYQGSDAGDITINADIVNNPKVVLNTNDKTITITGEAGTVTPPDPSDVTFYIIGSNVNGKSWALKAEDAKFEDLGNGKYKWTGTELGSGFKVNDGTWDHGNYNFGSAGSDELSMNVPYYYWADGSSGNIAFFNFTLVTNPVVELDLNDNTITIVDGETSGEYEWFIAGINGVFELTADWKLSPVEGSESLYARDIVITEEAANFKISDDGWSHQYGTNTPEDVFINPEVMEAQLEPVSGEGGNVDYELNMGTYHVTFDIEELYITFTDAAGVQHVFGGNDSAAEYFNLQGVKVARPDKGIFIKVVDGKAEKVVF